MEEEIIRLRENPDTGTLNKSGHANFCMRCLTGLPATMAEVDSSRIAIGFYCLGALDILGLLDAKLKAEDKEGCRAWIWAQEVRRPSPRRRHDAYTDQDLGNLNEGSEAGDSGDTHISGFRPGPFMLVWGDESESVASSMRTAASEADPPHLIMTYTALLALAILRDEFSQLDRRGLVNFLRAAQREDGSFSAFPGQGEADLRMVYTAFAISAMLDDWSGVDVPSAIAFAKRCMSYEGGFGQAPGNEAQGGPTYCAIATLALAPSSYRSEATLSARERKKLERWLVRQQQPRRVYLEEYDIFEDDFVPEFLPIGNERTETEEERCLERRKERKVKIEQEVVEEGGGFAGRTEKEGDACYSFWCGAALRILSSGVLDGGDSLLSPSPPNTRSSNGPDEDESEVEGFVDRLTHARFLSRCQFRLGGLAKAPIRTPGTHPDPYHTYLALAALSLYPPYPHIPPHPHPHPGSSSSSDGHEERKSRERESWRLKDLDPLINATRETAEWAKERISGKKM